jgi:hypothetical protein
LAPIFDSVPDINRLMFSRCFQNSKADITAAMGATNGAPVAVR